MEIISYKLIFAKDALRAKSGNKAAMRKISELLKSIKENPRGGIGEVEQLKFRENIWSRRITKGDRITYSINEQKKEAVIFRMRGHYGDK